MSDSVRPHRQQPTRLPRPWDSPGKTLEWVTISFSNAWKGKVKVKSLSRVQLLATPFTAAYQAPPSMGFSRQEYWSGVPLPSLHQRGLECKVGSQETPGITGKFGLGVQNEAEKRLTEFSQENSLVITNTLFQQHKRRLYTWTSPDGRHWNQIDYILCNQRWRSSIQSAKTRPGADCGSDHELLIAKFRFKLMKVGKTTRSFNYDLNQIPYNYTVEVTNRFKGLDLIECLKN